MSGRRNRFRGNLLSSGKPLNTGDYGTRVQKFRLVSAGVANTIPLSIPGAPTNVVATLSGNNAAVITWDAPINRNGSINNGGSVITSYIITCSSGFTLNVLGSLTSALFTGLSNGTTFTFTIVAINSIGTSPQSTTSNEISTFFVPDAPTNVLAELSGNNAATITWNPPFNGGSVIIQYIITRSSGIPLNVLGSLTSALFTGLSGDTSYNFFMEAINRIGTSPQSTLSNTIRTPISAPDAPTNVLAELSGNNAAAITWTPPYSGGSVIIKYTITCNTGTPLDVSGSLTSALFTGLSNGTTFTFTMVAINIIGTSPASAPSNEITTPPI
jgi:hypothetical protein